MNDLPVPAPAHASALLMQIERLVRSDVEPSRIQSVLDLYNQERTRAQMEDFNRDLAGLQSEIFEISSSGTNPTFRSGYPKLHDLLKETRPLCAKYGISIRFGSSLQKTPNPPPLREGWQRVVCITSHVGGHWEESYLDAPPDIQQGARARTPVQAIGSTNTYLRRYLVMMTLNLVPGGMPEDNDGERIASEYLLPNQVDLLKKHVTGLGFTAERIADMLSHYDATDYTQIKRRDFDQLLNQLVRLQKEASENKNEQ